MDNLPLLVAVAEKANNQQLVADISDYAIAEQSLTKDDKEKLFRLFRHDGTKSLSYYATQLAAKDTEFGTVANAYLRNKLTLPNMLTVLRRINISDLGGV